MRHSFLSRVLSHAARGCWLAAGIAGGVVLGWAGGRWFGQSAPEPSVTARNTLAETIAPTTTITVNATNEFERTADLYERVRDADGPTIEQLLDSATIARSDERLDTWTVLYARWAAVDPAAALDHALAHGALIQTAWSRAWVHSIFSTWTRSNPSEAMSRLDLLPPGVALQATASVLSAMPPAYDQHGIPERLRLMATAVALPTSDWVIRVADDPVGALDEALQDDASTAGASRARGVALTLALRDPATAMAMVSGGEKSLQTDTIITEIAALWAKHDSQEVVDWALTRPPSKARSQVLAAALAVLAKVSPGTALEFASALPDSSEQRVVLPSVLASWAAVDPVAATTWYSAADRRLRGTALQGVVWAYAQSDANAALAWVMKLPPDESVQGLALLMTRFVQEDPLHASAIVQDMPAGAARNGAASGLVATWAIKDPQAAWRWARVYDDTAVAGQLLAAVLSSWAYRDARSAYKALRSLTDSALHDHAALGALTVSQETDDLLAIYDRISDPGLKSQAARTVHDVLKYTDPVRAEEFATSARLADASP